MCLDLSYEMYSVLFPRNMGPVDRDAVDAAFFPIFAPICIKSVKEYIIVSADFLKNSEIQVKEKNPLTGICRKEPYLRI